MQLFYSPNIDEQSKTIEFDKDESRHIFKSLRKKIGDHLFITNGSGWMFEVEITELDQKKCLAKILKSEKQTKHNYYFHLAVAPTKMNDRFEWILEKATEIGIDEISPILCENSERKVIKEDRFERILLSAMKQSLRTHLPKLNPLRSFSEFIKQVDSNSKFIAHCVETDKENFHQQIRPSEKIVLLIGPEGDFSVKEIEMALAQGFKAVSLGESRLRTETAAIVGCASVAMINS